MSHELNATFEVDGKYYVVPEAIYNTDNMTASEIVKASIAVFSTQKKADNWAKKRSDNYRGDLKIKKNSKEKLKIKKKDGK